MTPKNEVEHGVCSYCGADRSGPSAEAHEPNCLYAEPEPQGSDNSAGPGVPPSAELKERARELAHKLWSDPDPHDPSTKRVWDVYFSEDEAAEDIAAFASSILEEARQQIEELKRERSVTVTSLQGIIEEATRRLLAAEQQLAEARAQVDIPAEILALRAYERRGKIVNAKWGMLNDDQRKYWTEIAESHLASLSAETEQKEKS